MNGCFATPSGGVSDSNWNESTPARARTSQPHRRVANSNETKINLSDASARRTVVPVVARDALSSLDTFIHSLSLIVLSETPREKVVSFLSENPLGRENSTHTLSNARLGRTNDDVARARGSRTRVSIPRLRVARRSSARVDAGGVDDDER